MLKQYPIPLQLTGLFILIVGLWAEFDLYKYMELSSDFSGTAPHVIIGIASLIVLISSVAFSCIIKGQPVLLYIVSDRSIYYFHFKYIYILKSQSEIILFKIKSYMPNFFNASDLKRAGVRNSAAVFFTNQWFTDFHWPEQTFNFQCVSL